MPLAVWRATTKNVPKAIKAIFDASPMPNNMTMSGTQATAGTGAITAMVGCKSHEARRLVPIKHPKKIPMTQPFPKPKIKRWQLMQELEKRLPSLIMDQRASSVSAGLAIKVAGTSDQRSDISHTTKKMAGTISPSRKDRFGLKIA